MIWSEIGSIFGAVVVVVVTLSIGSQKIMWNMLFFSAFKDMDNIITFQKLSSDWCTLPAQNPEIKHFASLITGSNIIFDLQRCWLKIWDYLHLGFAPCHKKESHLNPQAYRTHLYLSQGFFVSLEHKSLMLWARDAAPRKMSQNNPLVYYFCWQWIF